MIPPDREPVRDETTYNDDGTVHREPRQRVVNPKTAMLLALVPGLFGLLGLGVLYRNPRDPRGLGLLALGLVVFIVANTMLFLTVGLSLILVIPLIILYFLLYLAALFMTLVSGTFMTIRI